MAKGSEKATNYQTDWLSGKIKNYHAMLSFLKNLLFSRNSTVHTHDGPHVGHQGGFWAKVKFAEADVRGAKKASGTADPKI